ncbi:MAG: hypothetical protein V1898_01155 [Patescibacteria group bacterium]
MLLLAHLYLAKEVKNNFQISDEKEYYLASILPDIRYFVDVPRSKTHFTVHELNNKLHNINKDLLNGYAVHLLSDKFIQEFELYSKVRNCFPCIIKNIIKPNIVNIFLDLYFLEKLKQEKKLEISNNYYEEFNNLEISKESFNRFYSSTSKIIFTLSINTVTQEVFNNNNLSSNRKVRCYLKLSQLVLSSNLLKKYIIKKIDIVIKDYLVQFDKYIIQICRK